MTDGEYDHRLRWWHQGTGDLRRRLKASRTALRAVVAERDAWRDKVAAGPDAKLAMHYLEKVENERDRLQALVDRLGPCPRCRRSGLECATQFEDVGFGAVCCEDCYHVMDDGGAERGLLQAVADAAREVVTIRRRLFDALPDDPEEIATLLSRITVEKQEALERLDDALEALDATEEAT